MAKKIIIILIGLMLISVSVAVADTPPGERSALEFRETLQAKEIAIPLSTQSSGNSTESDESNPLNFIATSGEDDIVTGRVGQIPSDGPSMPDGPDTDIGEDPSTSIEDNEEEDSPDDLGSGDGK